MEKFVQNKQSVNKSKSTENATLDGFNNIVNNSLLDEQSEVREINLKICR